MQGRDVLLCNVFKLSYASVKTLSTVLPDGIIHPQSLILQHRQDIRPKDDGPAGKISQPQDGLDWIRKKNPAMRELNRYR